MKIAYSPYELTFRANYATVGQDKRQGVLLRVIFNNGEVGFCDCHPWELLGDLPLNEQLSALKSGIKTSLLRRSLYFARLDAKARAQGRSLFEGLKIPASHLLVTFSDNIDQAVAAGIFHFKLKCGSRPSQEIKFLTDWLERHPQIKFRLDFNTKLSRPAFLAYWQVLPPAVRAAIDFVEDPYAYQADCWSADQQQLGLAFAADRDAKQALQVHSSAQVIVHKPAVENLPEHIDNNVQLVVTTYLDHPFGQMCAAYVAAKLKARYAKQVECCGLLTHTCYLPDSFLAEVHAHGPFLMPAAGSGFGFDALLAKMRWHALY